jgi:hypothetical protein
VSIASFQKAFLVGLDSAVSSCPRCTSCATHADAALTVLATAAPTDEHPSSGWTLCSKHGNDQNTTPVSAAKVSVRGEAVLTTP